MPPRLRRLITTGLIIGLIAITVVSLIGFLAKWIWQGDMINAFRPQIAVGATLILMISLWIKGWVRTAALAVFLLTLMPIGSRLVWMDALPLNTKSNGLKVSLLVSNVLSDNDRYEDILEMVAKEQPEIFLAIETSPRWIDALKPLGLDYPYRFATADQGNMGMTVYAKHPFTANVTNIGSYEAPLMRLDFGDFILFAAHPFPPATPRMTSDNRIYLKALAREVNASKKPVIVAGDLNATLWSYSLTPLVEAKMQRPQGSGFAYTWPADNPLMAIQIDHVLTRNIPAARFKVLPSVGSDHFPIRADIDLGAAQ